jgi:hypothetical protein
MSVLKRARMISLTHYLDEARQEAQGLDWWDVVKEINAVVEKVEEKKREIRMHPALGAPYGS